MQRLKNAPGNRAQKQRNCFMQRQFQHPSSGTWHCCVPARWMLSQHSIMQSNQVQTVPYSLFPVSCPSQANEMYLTKMHRAIGLNHFQLRVASDRTAWFNQRAAWM